MNKIMLFRDKVVTPKDNERYITALTESEAVQRTLPFLEPNHTVLDFGCRTGNNTLAIAAHVNKIYGLDYSSSEIKYAKRRAATQNIQNVHFKTTDLFDTSYQEESFDCILAYHVLHLVDHPETIMHRINSLLKPNGLLISATNCWGEGRSVRKAGLSFLNRLGVIPRTHKYNVAELENIVTLANFEIRKTHVLDERYTDYFMIAQKQ